MPAAILACVVLVLLTVFVHYEALRLISRLLPAVRFAHRARMIVVVVGVFLAHTIEIGLYALGYMLMVDRLGAGTIAGEFGSGFADYVYFSAVTYTSLGIGDIYPVGGVRLLSGIEALNGLVLIGWSASFTYIAMERLWALRADPWTHDWRG